MTGAWRRWTGCALAVLAVLLCGSACSDDEAPNEDGLGDRRDVSFDDLSDALGCDSMEQAWYEPLSGKNGATIGEEARDCHRDGRFLGRVHLFHDRDRHASDAMSEALGVRLGPAPECRGEEFRVVTGRSWAIVTPGEAVEQVQDSTGGRALQMPMRTLPSYVLPCAGEASAD